MRYSKEYTALGLKKPNRKPKELLQQEWRNKLKSFKERR
jgi:hypothetical protein